LDDNYFLSAERYQESPEQSGITNLVAIGDILELAPTEKVASRDVPIMSITMARGLIDQGDKFKRRIASESISDYKLVRRDNLVVGFPIDEGVLGFLRKYDFAAVSPAYGIWQLKNGNDINIDYLEKILRSTQMRAIYAANMQVAVSRRRSVPKDVFTKLTVPIPSLEEQEQLVAELDGYEAIISGATQVIQNWKPRIIVDPEWEKRELGDICDVYQPKTITGAEILNDGPFKVYGANGVIGFYDKFNHPEAEVAVTCRGATCGTVNFTEPESWITGNAMVVSPKDKTISKKFLQYLLISTDLNPVITGSAQPQITGASLKPFEIHVPPIDVQEVIIELIDKEASLVNSAKQLIEMYETRTKFVIEKLWSAVEESQ
jgi:restriction endonuclease S subunit